MDDSTGQARRRVLHAGSLWALVAVMPSWLRAESRGLAPTLELTAGPFYPDTIPLDHDNDLLHYAQRDGTPRGIPLNLGGRILDRRGRAVPDVRVEIWQCDANGRYHYVDDPRNPGQLDLPFQGYGSFNTGVDGAYRFRTIRPVPYPGRTAHIHFKLSGEGFGGLTTQMFVAGEPLNAKDGIYNEISDRKARAALTVALTEDKSGAARLAGRFDIVLDADGRFDQAAAIAHL